ncbi:MAG TPA: GHMP kinase [Candidatus Handelsmanbacteria bacterium]|nr:GHMP kinase [Candidatus Handelsmanbacteria bacterium]
MPEPLRIINSVAPIRICDNGGWTDTWFAEYGAIFNIGVYPYAEAQLKIFRRDQVEDRIVIHAENFAERFSVERGNREWNHHPLLEAAVEYMNVPQDVAFEVGIYSEAPAGASTGTSAAVTVALIGALDLLTSGRMTPYEVAQTAQKIETEMLGQQCGIQDQLCSAFGGINYIEMYQYPHASVSQLHIPDATWWELERRLALVFLGKSHSSSDVHETVIADLEGAAPDNAKLEDLRQTAAKSRDAVYAGDLVALGRAMIENTEAQARLHPDLVSAEAHQVIELAQAHGALGWKVNGAGGDGGSLTLLLGAESDQKRALVRALKVANPLFQHIPIYLSRFGLRVWNSP